MNQTNLSAVIILDTLRKDFADKYIWPKLKKRGFKKVDNMVSPSPWTAPTHASLLTGMYPLYHGVHESKQFKGLNIPKLPTPTVITKLKHIGYYTILLSENPYIHPFFGYTEFDFFYTPSTNFTTSEKYITARRLIEKLKNVQSFSEKVKIVATNANKIPHVLAYAIKKLTVPANGWPLDKGISEIMETIQKLKISNENIFMLINLSEMHTPRVGERKLSPLEMRGILPVNDVDWISSYKTHAKYLAHKLKELLDLMESSFDELRLIITSDHGELLGEHGVYGHGTFLYDELLRVPFYELGFEVQQRRNGYFSLTQVPKLLLEKHIDPLPYVLSESFGIQDAYSVPNNASKEILRKIHKLEQYRIAIYYNDSKGIFNVSTWQFEKVEEKDYRKLQPTTIRNALVKYLKAATVVKHVAAQIG